MNILNYLGFPNQVLGNTNTFYGFLGKLSLYNFYYFGSNKNYLKCSYCIVCFYRTHGYIMGVWG